MARSNSPSTLEANYIFDGLATSVEFHSQVFVYFLECPTSTYAYTSTSADICSCYVGRTCALVVDGCYRPVELVQLHA